MTRSYARNCARRALAAAIAVAIVLPASALAAATLPTGPSVISGTEVFHPGTDVLTMDQGSTDAEVNWSSFSVGPGGSLIFQVPGGSSSVHHDLSGQASVIDGTWGSSGSADVTLENSQSILIGGQYLGGGGGSLHLLGGSVVALNGQVDLHGPGTTRGGDLWLKADYLEVGGSIDVSADDPVQRGTVHIESTRQINVVDTITTALGSGSVPAGTSSQVATGTLAASGGNVDLKGYDVYVGGHLIAPGNLSLSGNAVWTGSGSSVGAGGDITFASATSFSTGGSITTPGRLDITTAGSLFSGEIHAGSITINDRQSIHQDDHDGSGGWYTSLLTGSAGYGATLLNKANQIDLVQGFQVNETFQLANNANIVLRDVQVQRGVNLDAQGHDIDASDSLNTFDSVWVSGRNINVASTESYTVYQVAASGDATFSSAGSIELNVPAEVAGNLTVRSAGGTISTQNVYPPPLFHVGGSVTLDAGNGTIYFGTGHMQVGKVTANGGTVSLSGPFEVGDVTASVVANIGGNSLITGRIDAPSFHAYDTTLTNTGSFTGDLTLEGALTIDRSDRFEYDNDFAGTNTGVQLIQAGSGVTVLNGKLRFVPQIAVNAGTLMLGDSTHPGATATDSAVQVASGATLAGNGTWGNVSVASGGHLSPGDGVGTMSMGILRMEDGSHIDFDMGTPGPNLSTYGDSDSLSVSGLAQFNGNVWLDVNNVGALAPGFYHVLDYYNLVENGGGLQLGVGNSTGYLSLIRDPAHSRIDLLNTAGTTLSVWNANGLANGVDRGGGSGTWSRTSANWANTEGTQTGPMAPQPGFAIFAGEAGQVHADASQGALSVLGMQFVTNGYRLDGAPIELAQGASGPVIRVGDGQGSEGVTATIANNLTGSHGLAKTDPGTLVLTGHNSWTGGTVISGGVIAISADDGLGSGDVTFNGGTLRILGDTYHNPSRRFGVDSVGGIDIADAGNTFALNQALYGRGRFVKSGPGTLQMTGFSRYSGMLDVQEGTLRGDADSLFVSQINVHGTLVYDQSIDAATVYELLGDGLVVKQGAGTLSFNGYGQYFSGTTHVDAGTLVVGDQSAQNTVLGGDVAVAHGAVLAGYGTIGGSVTTHGYVLPGYVASVTRAGVLDVGGNVDFGSDSTLMITGEPGNVGKLAVNGHVTVTPGARLVVDAQVGQWVADQKYDVLTAAGGVTGTFSSINSNFAFLNTLIAYSESGNISLILQRNAASLQDVAVTPNQRAVATAAGTLGAGHAVYDRLVALDATSARTAFTSLAGSLHASTQGAVLDSQRQVRDAVTRHLGDADLPGGQRADDGRVSTWLSVIGRDADYDGNANAARINTSDSGVLLGADLAVSEGARVGAVLGHVKQNLHERASGGSADVKGNQFGVYGDVVFDALHLSGGVVEAHHSIDTRRDVTLGADTTRAYASRGANTTQGFAELGYALGHADDWKVEPFVQAAVVRWSGDKATEHGSTGALVVDDATAHVTTGRAGVHLGTALDRQARFGLQATLAWQGAWGETTPTSRLRFAEGGATFATTGVPLARNAGIVDAGVVVRLTPALRLDASYTGQIAGKVSDHGGRVSLNMTF